MTALEWLRIKATQQPTETDTFSSGETYRITRWIYRGNLPYRMKKDLVKAETTNTDFESEIIRFPGQYRTNNTYCEYYRIVYEPVSA